MNLVGGIYIASRSSVSGRSAEWRSLRDQGWNIICSWIDADPNCADPDLGELWLKIGDEIKGAERLILYVEPNDFPLKGALIEVGMAISAGIPVYVVAPGVAVDPVSYRPIGSWVNHPLVTMSISMNEALNSQIHTK